MLAPCYHDSDPGPDITLDASGGECPSLPAVHAVYHASCSIAQEHPGQDAGKSHYPGLSSGERQLHDCAIHACSAVKPGCCSPEMEMLWGCHRTVAPMSSMTSANLLTTKEIC